MEKLLKLKVYWLMRVGAATAKIIGKVMLRNFLPSVGPINIGCFVKVVWNRLQDSECQDVNVREAEPTLHHNQSNLRPGRISFPRNENPIQEWENLRKERKDLRIDGPDTIVEHV